MSEDESARTLSRGTRIGPYVIERPLGAGAFGAVYEARKKPLDKRIALKVLHPEHAQSGSIGARFIQEAQAAASLKHPHIVDVDDIGVIDGTPYLAMEFLDGESLGDMLQREGAITPARALDIMLPVLSAVAAVHEKGIVHRDLKPDNIFLWKPVAGQLHPKLLDFGIAKVREGVGAGLTKTGAIMGTPMFMSPEQWGGSKHATGQSDQWALGVILFQCLTGHLPFEADELPALMMRISMHPPASLRSFAPGISEALEQIVMRALEKDPLQRHSSVREFGKALLPFASAATRARWSAEFVGANASMGSMATLEASGDAGARYTPLPMVPTAVPNTLNASVRSVDTSAQTERRPRRVGRMLAAFGALALVGVGFGASQMLGGPRGAATTPVVARAVSAVSAPVVVQPTVVQPARIVVPAGSVDAGVAPGPVRPVPTRRPHGGHHHGGLMI